MMNRKSQITVEFMIMTAIVLVSFMAVLSAFASRGDEFYSMRTRLYAADEADQLAAAISTSFLAGDTAQTQLSLPSSLVNGENYTIDILPQIRQVQIRWQVFGQQRHYTSTLITSNITGNLSELRDRMITIQNRGGGIIIG